MLHKEKSLGRTDMLVQAAFEGKRIVVEDMVEVGVDVNGEDREGQSALAAAVSCSWKDIVRILLDEGADASTISKKENATPLMIALRKGNNAIVRMLLHAGADADVTACGDTALCIAISMKNFEIIDELCQASTIIDAPGKENKAPIHIAAKAGDMKMVQHLVGHGADLDLFDGNLKAPLFYAKQLKDKSIEAYLKKNGASKVQHLPSASDARQKDAQPPSKQNSPPKNPAAFRRVISDIGRGKTRERRPSSVLM